MKHDLEAFSRELVSLIKSSGDTGVSGDKMKKSPSDKDFFVPTKQNPMSPVKLVGGQLISASGDGKASVSQTLGSAVPSVPAATTRVIECPERGVDAVAPAEWHAILADLERHSCPEWMSPDRWKALLSDAEIFLTRWGSAAHSLGWSALDLYGVHPLAPASRFDVMGLLFLTQGGAVVALTADGATIRRETGAVLTYRRNATPGGVLVSTLLGGSNAGT